MLMRDRLGHTLFFFLQCAVVFTLAVSHLHAAENDGKKSDKDGVAIITDAELQSQVMAYADRYWSIMNSAGIEYMAQSPSSDNLRIVRAQLVLSAADAFRIAAGPKPVASFLDMVVMVTLGRMIFEEHYAKQMGEEVTPVVDGFKIAEADIWEIADRLLTEKQHDDLMALITDWRRSNPDVVVFSSVRFSEFEKARGESDVSGKKSSGGLFQSVAKATAQVEEARLLAERGMYLSTRFPMLIGGFSQMWVSNLVRNPDVSNVLSDLHRISTVSDRMATVAEKLPDDIAKERQATIDQLVDRITTERRNTINQVFNELARERRQTIKEFLAEEQRMRGLLTDLKLTLNSGNNLLTSTNTLVESLNLGKTDESTVSPSKPFDINDYKATLQEASNTIIQLHSLVKTIDQMGLERTLPQILATIDQIEKRGEKWVLQAFMLGIILILILLLGAVFAMLLYRYMAQRMFITEQNQQA